MATCNKEDKCDSYTELTDRNHLVDLSPLNGAPELLDTLTKYTQLQVYKVFNLPDTNGTTYGMHCHVFYKGLKVFSDNYQLWKSRWDNSISGDSTIIDTINISLTPTIQFEKAISIARQKMDFDNTCISYRLGITDINASISYSPKLYKLVWRINGSKGNEYPWAIIDANSGQIYSYDSGIMID
jgi:hypothetical protein